MCSDLRKRGFCPPLAPLRSFAPYGSVSYRPSTLNLYLRVRVLDSLVHTVHMTDQTRPTVRVPVPPPRSPARADWAGRIEALRGQRVYVANEAEVFRGFYAWSELDEDAEGFLWVEVVPEVEWWAFRLLGHTPLNVVRWPAGAVWLD